jgi:hypothetical protein
MTPEERIEMAELHDLYDKHTVAWCDPAYNTAHAQEGAFCTACNLPLFKRTLVNSAGNAIWDVGIGLKDRRLMLSSDRPFSKHLKDMRDKELAADIMAALLLWHVRVQGMENPPMYYCNLAASIGANSPDLRRVVRDCGGWLAYDYCMHFPQDEPAELAKVRAAALASDDPRLAYNMAVYIDKHPSQDTWDIIKQHSCREEYNNYIRWKGYPRNLKYDVK